MALEGSHPWPCKYCGGSFYDLSEHFPTCPGKRRADDLKRLDLMEGELAKPALALPSPQVVPVNQYPPPVKAKAGFDRAAYHKAYMKTYMRAYMRKRRGKT